MSPETVKFRLITGSIRCEIAKFQQLSTKDLTELCCEIWEIVNPTVTVCTDTEDNNTNDETPEQLTVDRTLENAQV